MSLVKKMIEIWIRHTYILYYFTCILPALLLWAAAFGKAVRPGPALPPQKPGFPLNSSAAAAQTNPWPHHGDLEAGLRFVPIFSTDRQTDRQIYQHELSVHIMSSHGMLYLASKHSICWEDLFSCVLVSCCASDRNHRSRIINFGGGAVERTIDRKLWRVIFSMSVHFWVK